LALDWALAVAMGLGPDIGRHCYARYVQYTDYKNNIVRALSHTDPATCMGLMACEYGKVWKAEAIPRTTTPTVLVMGFSSVGADVTKANGQTLAEAVARCVVAMRLGDEVEVPDELVGVQG